MKVALVLPGSIWYAPYVRIYTKILNEHNIEYAIISWNREGDDKPEGFQYNVVCASGHNSAGWKAYRGYIRFIKETIKKQGFDRIIVFGPQMTCMLSMYLLHHFKGRYMIDYRDLSIEQKTGFKQLFALMLRNSRVNVISSSGYKEYLPKGGYVISHNFDIDVVRNVLNNETCNVLYNKKDVIDVLTIGAIRDLGSNMEVVKALGNQEGIEVKFVGKGDAAIQIKEYCDNNRIKNVHFHGFYKKEEEAAFIQSSDLLNIFYPYIKTHNTALSNRFYNSLIYKKPMLVNQNTTQGNYAEEYGVGIVVSNCDNLSTIIREFFRTLDYGQYEKNCNALLRIFLNDYNIFENSVLGFLRS